MDKILKLVNSGNADKFLDDPAISHGLNILISKKLVKNLGKQVIFTENGVLAFKIGFYEYEKMTEKKKFKFEPVSDKAVLYFLRNWNRKRIIGLITWFILLILWAILRYRENMVLFYLEHFF